MSLRRSLPLLTVLTLAACTPTPERAAAKQDAPKPDAAKQDAESSTPAADGPDYASFGMPDPSVPWTVNEYARAHKALNAIAKQDRTLLPRAGSPIFAALTGLDHLGQLAAGVAPEQLAGLTLSLGMAQMTYGDQVGRDPSFEREHLIISAAVLRVTTKLPGTVVRDEAQAQALRGEPARLASLLRFRHGVYEMVTDVLQPARASVLPPSFACEQLAGVIDEVAPLLLPEEREAVRLEVRKCASAGSSAEAIERLDAALADEARSAALVTALLDEHRGFAATKAAPPETQP